MNTEKEEKILRPGEFPFTRGIHPEMYRARPWTIRPYAGFGDATTTNKRYKELLNSGATGLSMAFDLPTQMGLDSDSEMATGEVGRVGVAIDTVEDMAQVFDGIDLGAITTSMTINATAPIMLAMYLVVAEERGISWSDIGGTTQNDILKEYVARGTYIFPPEPSLRLITDMIGFCGKHLFKWNPISISGYHIREAGSTAVQELALTMADGITYLQKAIESGLDPVTTARQLAFFFSCDSNFLEEVAKFRAARRMWAHIVRDRFKIADVHAQKLRFHVHTGGSTLTRQDPNNNVVRVTLEALAAIMGGCQSLYAVPLDEAIGLPAPENVRLALNTQMILAHETGITSEPDPFGGSYVVEALTDKLEKEANKIISSLDESGGMLRAIEAGIPQRMVAEEAWRKQQAIEKGERKVVGLNFPLGITPLEPTQSGQSMDQSEIELGQRTRLYDLKTFRRHPAKLEDSLEQLRNAVASKHARLMPAIIDAVRERASVGEICEVLQSVFGRYHPVGIV